jgi:hypothetical protein
MRRIKITDKLKLEVINFNEKLFISTRTEGFEHPKHRLEKIYRDKKLNRYSKHKKYIKKIIDEYDNILNANPAKMESLIKEFDSILQGADLAKKVPDKRISFHEKIVWALRYEDLRNKEYPEYLQSSYIRACIYCNCQSTIVIERTFYNKKKRKIKDVQAKLQLDHFYPKSKYPFLATSFFNLYPTCANCNLAKGDRKSLFQLYTLTDDLDLFNFWLDNKSLLKYWMKFDIKDLKVIFEAKNSAIEMSKNHNELFQIQAIYDKQIDVAEELAIKARANPETYRRILTKEFEKLFPDSSIIDRIIVGNYTKPEETHKRPLSKYSQDIAIQLKLIK